MPANHVVRKDDRPVVHVWNERHDVTREAVILETRPQHVYVHYLDSDKRMDEWIAEDRVASQPARKRKRAQSSSPARQQPSDSELGPSSPEDNYSGNGVFHAQQPQEVEMSEAAYDLEHHKQIMAQRNFDKVAFGEWEMKTWYFSPYPLTENEDPADTHQPSTSTPDIPGLPRGNFRHKRTADIFAGGLGRSHGLGEKSTLWVCEFCLKYMTDGMSWEVHRRSCNWTCPPGRKVYQRGAHTIYEVDGQHHKLYCQNLSLFGKLFIDVKTLFFDCDNFMFYVLTDAKSSSDHIIGFFSKEKVSYDDYNLACIITLPPYQRKGYGILMIEFSYELSRQAGKVGTPERPLSDLGLRSYLSFWVGTLIRFLRRVLTILPPGTFITDGKLPDIDPDNANSLRKKKKKAKGFDGEVTDELKSDDVDTLFTSDRQFVTIVRDDGSAVTNIFLKCTLADIARATNLRTEDAAFALNEIGLLSQRLSGDSELKSTDTIVITREMVEQVAKERNVKKPCISLSHVTL